jgi:hypothetical protein
VALAVWLKSLAIPSIVKFWNEARTVAGCVFPKLDLVVADPMCDILNRHFTPQHIGR